MEDIDIQRLYDNFHRRIAKISLDFKRYLYFKINWNARMIGIKGARGVGKTTMLLQHILDNYKDIDKTLYASLDDLWFTTHDLMDVIDWADRHGINHLYLDEVHRYKDWSETLKNIYDNYPDMHIVYTSSSLLAVDNAKVDLSRRQTMYMMFGFSFREYLAFEGAIDIQPIPIDDLLRNHVRYAMQITKDIKPAPLFEAFLNHGYYPFYREAGDDFHIRLREIVSVIVDTDVPAVENVSFDTLQKMKKLLMLISEHVPFEPNMSELWKQLSTNNELGLRMLYALDRAQILTLLTAKSKSYKYLYKPDKILLNNTNLMHALCPAIDRGNERETFFLSQMVAEHDVKMPQKGDFLVDDQYLFEVGGKRKTFDQIKDLPQSYLAVDDTEIGSTNRIPLWMFGLTY
ncbi:MAG: AAA family ATPase [Lentisphaeria bacterium]|nr:AAA family ATPase [Lentisphaeria bacterium]